MMFDWRALYLSAVKAVVCTLVNQQYKEFIVSQIITVKGTLTHRQQERQLVSCQFFFIINVLLTAGNRFMETIHYCMCVWLCMFVMHTFESLSTCVYAQATAIDEWSASFVTPLFPSHRRGVVICIQHLKLWLFNAAIKLISNIKYICDKRVGINHVHCSECKLNSDELRGRKRRNM